MTLQRDPDMRHRAGRGYAENAQTVHVPTPRASQDPPTVPHLVWVQPPATPPDPDRVGPILRGRDGVAYRRVRTLLCLLIVLVAVFGVVAAGVIPGAA